MSDATNTTTNDETNPPSVRYSSTRGCTSQSGLRFRDVVMRGLAHDRGLFVPDTLPTVGPDELEGWRSLGYADLAIQVLRKFVRDDEVPRADLEGIVRRSCAAFRSEEVTPLVEIDGHFVMELFHGPTFAFKDVALQMLGNFFEYFLRTGSNGGRLAVLGATSGDTGSAAIYGLRGKKGVDCIILYPEGRVSEIQERQMITVTDANVHCVAVEGTFDDCQDLVKASFNDSVFREEVKLGAVNSINWCRVLAQTTYYFWSYLRVTDAYPDLPKVHYSVPTGNFGDVLAGYYAKQMGLPVGKLIVATNENDILHRFFTTGEYHRHDIQKTISPSMDICVSSNFERYLYHLAGNDHATLRKWMLDFETTGKLTVDKATLEKAQTDFTSARADTAQTLDTIKHYATTHTYLLCPHSAVGVDAVRQLDMKRTDTVCLATAHPGKFPDACRQAVPDLPPPPPELASMKDKPTRNTRCPNDLRRVQEFVRECVHGKPSETKKKGAVRKSGCVGCSLVKIVTIGALASLGAVLAVKALTSRRR